MCNVKISPGNTKMGSIPSVSLPAIDTCRVCDCQRKCYAKKLERTRPTVRNAYRHNLDVLNSDPTTYWREVEAAIMMSRFFRFHVSGDIPSAGYFCAMADIAKRNSHCQILCFTKRFDFINDVIAKTDMTLPDNLHIIFSAWPGLEMVNPYRFPEAHVRFRDGSTTANQHAIECSGNCADCAITDSGCWTLRFGEQVIFNEH